MNSLHLDASKRIVTKAKPGVQRWTSAFTNSYNGLIFGLKSESAIREEIFALIIAAPLAMYLVDSTSWRLAMVLSVLLVLIVEVLNTAIETTLDRVSTEYNDLTKAGKDLGSLAVLLSLIAAIAVWVVAITHSGSS